MSHSICCVPVASVRVDPDHRSEMVSQLLFGERAIITFKENGWCKIVSKADAYTGWCLSNQLQEVSEETFNLPASGLAGGWINEIEFNGQRMMIPFGSSLTALIEGRAVWMQNVLQYNGLVWDLHKVSTRPETIKKIAFTFLNTPYLWGGRSVFGIDCSGFTQLVYKFLDIPLQRDAHMQAMQGELVGFIQQAHCGDLAFFDDENGKIIHVGILLNDHEIIHAAGKVRIDKIDNQGIINSETGERTSRLRVIKRYL